MTTLTDADAIVSYVPVRRSRRRQLFVGVVSVLATTFSAVAFVNRHSWFAGWYEWTARREGRRDAERDLDAGTAHVEYVGRRWLVGQMWPGAEIGEYDSRTGLKTLRTRAGDELGRLRQFYVDAYNETVTEWIAVHGPPANSVLHRFRQEDAVARALREGAGLGASGELRLPDGRRVLRGETALIVKKPDGSHSYHLTDWNHLPNPRIGWDATGVFIAFALDEITGRPVRCVVIDTEVDDVIQGFDVSMPISGRTQ